LPLLFLPRPSRRDVEKCSRFVLAADLYHVIHGVNVELKIAKIFGTLERRLQLEASRLIEARVYVGATRENEALETRRFVRSRRFSLDARFPPLALRDTSLLLPSFHGTGVVSSRRKACRGATCIMRGSRLIWPPAQTRDLCGWNAAPPRACLTSPHNFLPERLFRFLLALIPRPLPRRARSNLHFYRYRAALDCMRDPPRFTRRERRMEEEKRKKEERKKEGKGKGRNDDLRPLGRSSRCSQRARSIFSHRRGGTVTSSVDAWYCRNGLRDKQDRTNMKIINDR